MMLSYVFSFCKTAHGEATSQELSHTGPIVDMKYAQEIVA